MMKSRKMRLAISLALTATMAAGLLTGSANADPPQLTAFIGVGSDTSQDVMNAVSGKAGLNFYTPIQSASGKQVVSFDATNATNASDLCITTTTGAPTINRPNGSSKGRIALSRKIDGTAWGTASCGIVSGSLIKVDFARSSAGPANGDSGTALAYVPFGLDAVSFASYKPSGALPAVTSLTKGQLTSIFTSATRLTVGGVTIIPCGIQAGSGTFQFWNTVTTASTTQENTATTQCNDILGVGLRAQENDGPDLIARGNALDPVIAGEFQVVIGFSAGAFIAKSNGVASPAPGAGVSIGSISDNGLGVNLGSPVVTGPSLTPNATFYADAVFGRRIYNVFPDSIINSAFGNTEIKELFKDTDPTAANNARLCNATTTIQTCGFLVAPTCGDSTTTKGSLLVGNS